MTPPSTSTSPEAAPAESSASSSPSASSGAGEQVRVPAQVIRRAPGSAPPVPAPRTDTPSAGIPTAAPASVGPAAADACAPAGLPTSEVPGLYAPQPTGTTEPLAGWALLAGILVPPLGIAIGLVALVRIRRRASGGRGLAVAGIVVGALITALMVLVLVLSALVSVGSAGTPSTPGSGDAASQTCSGTICTVTGRGAPLTIDGIGADGRDGVSVLAIGEGSATVASPQGPMEVPTGTALQLGAGTEVVLTQAGADTVVFVYGR